MTTYTARLAPSRTSATLIATDGGRADETRFYLAAGDRAPVEATLERHDDPLPLGDVSSVRFRMWRYDETLVDRRAEIIDADAGRVRYEWRRGETDLESGVYSARFVVHYRDGTTQSVPNTDTLSIVIT